MKKQSELKSVNWTVFIFLAALGIVSIIVTMIDLQNSLDPADPQSYQSRPGLRWSWFHAASGLAMLALGGLLAAGWKRLFPFNVPLLLILSGFAYEWFFLTFTIGWVGIQGLLGLFIAAAVSLLLMIYHVFALWSERKKQRKS